jgi:hypothetical protein
MIISISTCIVYGELLYSVELYKDFCPIEISNLGVTLIALEFYVSSRGISIIS